MQNYELLSHFYLGKKIDPHTLQRSDEYLLYDSKDLATHAICVGMTGSGKTGLGINLLEEAAMDNIPSLVIDPKGDMANLLLTFPELQPADFMPWIQASDAERAGLSLTEYAAKKADQWRNGLAEWEQDGKRIAALREKAEFAIYTPGSSAAKQLSILRMLDCPNQMILSDQEALQDYISSTASALLALLNIDANPLQSREHILLSTLLNNVWQKSQNLNLATLIELLADPPLEKVGILPLETFYPQTERMQLAMQFNNLLASPQFSGWLTGEPLDIQNLLYTPEGKPKVSILSINHLDDQQRMFFVSTFLNQVVSWIRTQSGTSSLRAILYMDEIFGYFPPVANPPSKKPLLLLLKQARAFGLGIILATQNPADLDYKGLANIGTWFIGRLQTEQDKARLLEGLHTAQQSGSDNQLTVNSQQISELLSKLPVRSFLMNNVHDQAPTLFETRWCMSYLAGPLSKQQISQLSGNKDSVGQAEPVREIYEPEAIINTLEQQSSTVSSPALSRPSETTEPPMPEPVSPNEMQTFKMAPTVPKDIEQYYLPAAEQAENIIYLPSLYAYVETIYENKTNHIFQKISSVWNTLIHSSVIPVDWQEKTNALADPYDLLKKPDISAEYIALPEKALKKTTYTQWSKDLIDYIYSNNFYTLYSNQKKTLFSQPDETKADFIVRLRQKNREDRDQEIEAVRNRYGKKIAALTERIRKAEQAVEREKGQASQAKYNTMINVGNTLLDTLLGNKKGFKKSSISKAASSARSAGRARQQQNDVLRAEETVATYQKELADLELALANEVQELTDHFNAKEDDCQEIQVQAKKKDIILKVFALLWLPYAKTDDNQLRPIYEQQIDSNKH